MRRYNYKLIKEPFTNHTSAQSESSLQIHETEVECQNHPVPSINDIQYEYHSHITIYFFPRCIVSCLVVIIIVVVVVVLAASVRLVCRAFDSGASRLDVRTKELVGRLHKDHRRKAISVVFWFWLGSTRAVLGVEF